MLKTEFDKLMGRQSTEDEYCLANLLYVSCDMDKQAFVGAYKTLEQNVLTKTLIDRNLLLEIQVRRCKSIQSLLKLLMSLDTFE